MWIRTDCRGGAKALSGTKLSHHSLGAKKACGFRHIEPVMVAHPFARVSKLRAPPNSLAEACKDRAAAWWPREYIHAGWRFVACRYSSAPAPECIAATSPGST